MDDEIWYELDVFDSSVGTLIESVISLIWGIQGKDAMANANHKELLCKIIEGLNTKIQKQLDQLSFGKDHTL